MRVPRASSSSGDSSAVEILSFTTYDLWTFLARREANLLVNTLRHRLEVGIQLAGAIICG